MLFRLTVREKILAAHGLALGLLIAVLVLGTVVEEVREAWGRRIGQGEPAVSDSPVIRTVLIDRVLSLRSGERR